MENKIHITEQIKELYAPGNNWNYMLYEYSEVFPDKDNNYKFHLDFLYVD